MGDQELVSESQGSAMPRSPMIVVTTDEDRFRESQPSTPQGLSTPIKKQRRRSHSVAHSGFKKSPLLTRRRSQSVVRRIQKSPPSSYSTNGRAAFGTGDSTSRSTWLTSPEPDVRISKKRPITPDPGQYRVAYSDFKLSLPHRKANHFGSTATRNTTELLTTKTEAPDPGAYNLNTSSFLTDKKSFRRQMPYYRPRPTKSKKAKKSLTDQIMDPAERRRQELGLPKRIKKKKKATNTKKTKKKKKAKKNPNSPPGTKSTSSGQKKRKARSQSARPSSARRRSKTPSTRARRHSVARTRSINWMLPYDTDLEAKKFYDVDRYYKSVHHVEGGSSLKSKARQRRKLIISDPDDVDPDFGPVQSSFNLQKQKKCVAFGSSNFSKHAQDSHSGVEAMFRMKSVPKSLPKSKPTAYKGFKIINHQPEERLY